MQHDKILPRIQGGSPVKLTSVNDFSFGGRRGTPRYAGNRCDMAQSASRHIVAAIETAISEA